MGVWNSKPSELETLIQTVAAGINEKLENVNEKLEKVNEKLESVVMELETTKAMGGFTYAAIEQIWEVDMVLDSRVGEKAGNESKEAKNETGVVVNEGAAKPNKAKHKYKEAADYWEKCRKKDNTAIEAYQGRAKKEIRQEDVFPSNLMFPGTGDSKTSSQQSMAHLIPKDMTCSLSWGYPLGVITGETGEKNMLRNSTLRNRVEGKPKTSISTDQEQDQKGTIGHAALKDWSWNFLKLPHSHYEHFDAVFQKESKGLIIVPVWNPNKKWTPGKAYKLLVAATAESYKWLTGINRLEQLGEQYPWLNEATQDELQISTDFLGLTVKALAHYLIVGDHMSGEDRDSLKKIMEDYFKKGEEDSSSKYSGQGNSQKSSKKEDRRYTEYLNKYNNIQSVRKRLTDGELLKIPRVSKLAATRKILTVDLDEYFKEKTQKQLIPDPFLVVLKAAANWSIFCGQRLLSACNVSDSESGNSDLPAVIDLVRGKKDGHAFFANVSDLSSIDSRVFDSNVSDTKLDNDDEDENAKPCYDSDDCASVRSGTEVTTAQPGNEKHPAVVSPNSTRGSAHGQ